MFYLTGKGLASNDPLKEDHRKLNCRTPCELSPEEIRLLETLSASPHHAQHSRSPKQMQLRLRLRLQRSIRSGVRLLYIYEVTICKPQGPAPGFYLGEPLVFSRPIDSQLKRCYSLNHTFPHWPSHSTLTY